MRTLLMHRALPFVGSIGLALPAYRREIMLCVTHTCSPGCQFRTRCTTRDAGRSEHEKDALSRLVLRRWYIPQATAHAREAVPSCRAKEILPAHGVVAGHGCSLDHTESSESVRCPASDTATRTTQEHEPPPPPPPPFVQEHNLTPEGTLDRSTTHAGAAMQYSMQQAFPLLPLLYYPTCGRALTYSHSTRISARCRTTNTAAASCDANAATTPCYSYTCGGHGELGPVVLSQSNTCMVGTRVVHALPAASYRTEATSANRTPSATLTSQSHILAHDPVLHRLRTPPLYSPCVYHTPHISQHHVLRCTTPHRGCAAIVPGNNTILTRRASQNDTAACFLSAMTSATDESIPATDTTRRAFDRGEFGMGAAVCPGGGHAPRLRDVVGIRYAHVRDVYTSAASAQILRLLSIFAGQRVCSLVAVREDAAAAHGVDDAHLTETEGSGNRNSRHSYNPNSDENSEIGLAAGHNNQTRPRFECLLYTDAPVSLPTEPVHVELITERVALFGCAGSSWGGVRLHRHNNGSARVRTHDVAGSVDRSRSHGHKMAQAWKDRNANDEDADAAAAVSMVWPSTCSAPRHPSACVMKDDCADKDDAHPALRSALLIAEAEQRRHGWTVVHAKSSATEVVASDCASSTTATAAAASSSELRAHASDGITAATTILPHGATKQQDTPTHKACIAWNGTRKSTLAAVSPRTWDGYAYVLETDAQLCRALDAIRSRRHAAQQQSDCHACSHASVARATPVQQCRTNKDDGDDDCYGGAESVSPSHDSRKHRSLLSPGLLGHGHNPERISCASDGTHARSLHDVASEGDATPHAWMLSSYGTGAIPLYYRLLSYAHESSARACRARRRRRRRRDGGPACAHRSSRRCADYDEKGATSAGAILRFVPCSITPAGTSFAAASAAQAHRAGAESVCDTVSWTCALRKVWWVCPLNLYLQTINGARGVGSGMHTSSGMSHTAIYAALNGSHTRDNNKYHYSYRVPYDTIGNRRDDTIHNSDDNCRDSNNTDSLPSTLYAPDPTTHTATSFSEAHTQSSSAATRRTAAEAVQCTGAPSTVPFPSTSSTCPLPQPQSMAETTAKTQWMSRGDGVNTMPVSAQEDKSNPGLEHPPSLFSSAVMDMLFAPNYDAMRGLPLPRGCLCDRSNNPPTHTKGAWVSTSVSGRRTCRHCDVSKTDQHTDRGSRACHYSARLAQPSPFARAREHQHICWLNKDDVLASGQWLPRLPPPAPLFTDEGAPGTAKATGKDACPINTDSDSNKNTRRDDGIEGGKDIISTDTRCTGRDDTVGRDRSSTRAIHRRADDENDSAISATAKLEQLCHFTGFFAHDMPGWFVDEITMDQPDRGPDCRSRRHVAWLRLLSYVPLPDEACHTHHSYPTPIVTPEVRREFAPAGRNERDARNIDRERGSPWEKEEEVRSDHTECATRSGRGAFVHVLIYEGSTSPPLHWRSIALRDDGSDATINFFTPLHLSHAAEWSWDDAADAPSDVATPGDTRTGARPCFFVELVACFALLRMHAMHPPRRRCGESAPRGCSDDERLGAVTDVASGRTWPKPTHLSANSSTAPSPLSNLLCALQTRTCDIPCDRFRACDAVYPSPTTTVYRLVEHIRQPVRSTCAEYNTAIASTRVPWNRAVHPTRCAPTRSRTRAILGRRTTRRDEEAAGCDRADLRNVSTHELWAEEMSSRSCHHSSKKHGSGARERTSPPVKVDCANAPPRRCALGHTAEKRPGAHHLASHRATLHVGEDASCARPSYTAEYKSTCCRKLTGATPHGAAWQMGEQTTGGPGQHGRTHRLASSVCVVCTDVDDGRDEKTTDWPAIDRREHKPNARLCDAYEQRTLTCTRTKEKTRRGNLHDKLWSSLAAYAPRRDVIPADATDTDTLSRSALTHNIARAHARRKRLAQFGNTLDAVLHHSLLSADSTNNENDEDNCNTNDDGSVTETHAQGTCAVGVYMDALTESNDDKYAKNTSDDLRMRCKRAHTTTGAVDKTEHDENASGPITIEYMLHAEQTRMLHRWREWKKYLAPSAYTSREERVRQCRARSQMMLHMSQTPLQFLLHYGVQHALRTHTQTSLIKENNMTHTTTSDIKQDDDKRFVANKQELKLNQSTCMLIYDCGLIVLSIKIQTDYINASNLTFRS